MAATKVIIAGGGIAGPVLAMFLKAKGYDPVIYERTDAPTDQGLSLAFVTPFESHHECGLTVPNAAASSRTDCACSS